TARRVPAHRGVRGRVQQRARARGAARRRPHPRRGSGVLPGRHGRLRPPPRSGVPAAARARRPGDPGQLRRVARRRPRRLRLRLHRSARQSLRGDQLPLHVRAHLDREQDVARRAAAPPAAQAGPAPRADVPRLAAGGERVPVGVGHPERLAASPDGPRGGRRDAVHPHRHEVAPRAARRPPRGERGSDRAARERRPHRGLVHGADRGGRSPGGVRAARLRSRDARPRDGPGGAAARVRGDDSHRVVDDLSREPARPRARPGQVLSRRLLVVTLLALALAVIVVRVLGLTDLVRLENLGRLRERIDGLGAWAPVVFIVGYVAAVVAFVPALPLTILAGLVFGPAWGTVYVAIAATAGACLSFLIARYAARAAVARWMAGHPALERMDRAVARHGFRIVMITRLVPIFPFNLQNYAYGLTSIGFGSYAVTSFLCMLPGTLAFTAAAGAVVAGAWDARRMLLLLALAGVLLVALSLLPRWLRGRSAALDD